MKLFNKSIKLSVSLAALVLAQASFADGTKAGTVVSNTATLSYSVGGAAQSDITSDVADFKVDQKVDLSVTPDVTTGTILVVPSSANTTPENKLTYTLSNDGNDEQKFTIAVSHLTGDNFDAGTNPATSTPLAAQPCVFTIDSGTAIPITSTGSVTLDIDKKAVIEVTCSMPNQPDVEDGHLSTIDVLATAVDAGNVIMKESLIADREDEVDIVLADGTGEASDGADRNAMHSATQTYEIYTPMLAVVKTSTVTEDPFNGTDDPKRIPGATIQYAITITNSSDTEAKDVKITDSLQAEIAGQVKYVASSLVNLSGNAEGTTGSATGYSSNVITADGITVPANGQAVVTFEVIVE